MDWKVIFYQSQRKYCPVIDFINKLDASTKAKTLHTIQLLQNNGPFLKEPYSKKLQRNLYELRIYGQISVRIFYAKIDNTYVLIHAFKKKSQKTPKKEIKVAVDRLKEVI